MEFVDVLFWWQYHYDDLVSACVDGLFEHRVAQTARRVSAALCGADAESVFGVVVYFFDCYEIVRISICADRC